MEAVAEHIKVPELRFPDFSGDWEEKQLGEMAQFRRGSFPQPYGLPKWYDVNGLPFVQVYDVADDMQLKESTKQKISKSAAEQSVFIPKDSLIVTIQGSIGRIAVTQYDAYVDRTLLIFTSFEAPVDIHFLKWELKLLFEYERKFAPGGTIKTITKEKLRYFLISLPSLPEQQKIAEFLTAVDEKIGKLKRKKELLEAYKKGAMQKLFSQEIRFKDDQGNPYPDWEEKRLGDCLFERSEKTSVNNQFEVLSSTAKGLFRQEEYFNRQIASKENIGYKILRKNQVVLSPQNLWLGNINLNQNFEIGIVSPSYKIFEISSEVHQGYLGPYLRIPRMFYEYAQASEQGASVVRRNLDSDLFSQIAINIPSLPEQQKIAEFLTGIDDKIKAVANQIDQAAQFKKGLLQKMFV